MNHRKISLVEQKKITLNILEKLIKIFEENNITYFAYFGTLLGAIRHGGMIPWDDDIDLAMPRSDYDKLCEIEWEKYNLKLSHPAIDPGYALSFGKLSDRSTFVLCNQGRNIFGSAGVAVDIFPIDGLPKYRINSYFQSKSIRMLSKIKSFKDQKICFASPSHFLDKIIKNLAIIFARTVSVKIILRLIDVISAVNKNSSEISCRVEPYFGRESINFDDLYPLNFFKFENVSLPIPKNYDKLLTQLYGDYMEPPDESNRESTHDVTYYQIVET